MNKRKKLYAVISVTALAVLMIPVAAALSAQISESKAKDDSSSYWDGTIIVGPPKEPGGPKQTRLVDPYAANGEMLVDDYEKERLLQYLWNFDEEMVTGNESAEEAERINRKNALLEEYRAYVDDLYMQVMPIERFDDHYDYLMDIFHELVSLEPEDTPEELLEIDLRKILAQLEEEWSKIELYHKPSSSDAGLLKESIETVTDIHERYTGQQIGYEQAKQEYAACLEEKVKLACTRIYSLHTEYAEE